MPRFYELSSSGWALWQSVCVRGAGFPAELVSQLAARDGLDAIDRVISLEQALPPLATAAISAVETCFQSLGGREDRARRRALAALVRKLEEGGAVEPQIELVPAVVAAIDAHRAAVQACQAQRVEAAAILEREHERCIRVLQAIGADPAFREAITWQNRHALHSGVDVLVRQSASGSTGKHRSQERFVASHLQRYCVKNDSISFFGPFGWAEIDLEAPSIVVRPGAQLVEARTVYLEGWAIDVLATSLAADPALRRRLPPRRHPTMRLDGDVLHFPLDRQSELPAEFARVLAACDGIKSARAIALEVLQESAVDISTEDEVYELLEEMAEKRMVIWTLEIPTHVEHPERILASLLAAVDPPEVAAPALAALADLCTARDAVATAAGDPVALDQTLAHLEEVFTTHTGVAANRRSGETYAARTIVYEDCRRALDMTISPAVLDRIARPLALLLQSARWFTFEIARRYRSALVALHRELVAERGSPTVDFQLFWHRAIELFSGDARKAAPLVAEVTAELQRRWSEVLGFADEATWQQHRFEVGGAQLARAAELFAAPHPGWPSARHHSPDLMIAASSVEAIARGEFMVVAGELHVGVATVTTPATARQHRDPASLIGALETDRPHPIIKPVASKERATRAEWYSLSDRDFDLEVGSTRSWRPRAHVLEAADLHLEETNDALVIRRRTDGRAFSIESLLDSFFSAESSSHFKLTPRRPHTPRITFDGMVIIRETWRFAGSELGFAQLEAPLERLLAVRRWARSHGLPRFAFYSIPEETKPCYLDLDSPHFVDLFTHLARKATELTVSEMLPALDELWLTDLEDRRYTAELRFVAVDPVPWPEPHM
ncbi:MAG: hypothetical protein JWP01_1938 [Myxococcales bacterium]|nr:hypothetical protein [Myxococcales bacterium]